LEEKMKRVSVGILVALLMTGLSTASTASAEGPKKKGGGKKHAEAVPNSAKIAEALGQLKWGISRDELVKDATDKVKEKYRPLLGKTKDAVQEDRLRQKAREELDAIKKGVTEFDGRTTGWDVSFLKGEFTHNNQESMVVVRDANSQNFYFFIGDKLWKWYKAFDASVFPTGNFGTFANAVQKRFGPAKDAQGELRPGDGARHWLEWQDKQTRLKAVDQSDFYGFYCLVFEEKSTVDNLARLRQHEAPSGDKKHSLVEAVTSQRTDVPDDSPNVVDRLTGRMRQNEQAPQQAEASAKPAKGSKKEAAPESPVAADDDPISGLGL
jgi:hypothetical protein